MRIFVTGGGSGGHVTPLRPVIEQLKSKDPDLEIVFIYTKGDKFAKLVSEMDAVDKSRGVYAGKWRKYSNQSLLEKIFDIRTLFLNFWDLLKLGLGFIQSVVLVGVGRPDVIFSKSGPASIPLGVAAFIYGVPVVTHDSDAIPSLTHRVIGRWSKFNAVAGDHGSYPYKSEKTIVVGVPVDDMYDVAPTQGAIDSASKILDWPDKNRPCLLIVGGSQGARSINDAAVNSFSKLVANFNVIHIAGQNNVDDVRVALVAKGWKEGGGEYRLYGFVSKRDLLYGYYLAADLLVCRASATVLAEAAALGKACIAIPAAPLVDQVNNARYLEKIGAAIVLTDEELSSSQTVLADAALEAVGQEPLLSQLRSNISKLHVSNSASKIAALIFKASETSDRGAQ